MIAMLAAGLLIYSLRKASEYQRRIILILGIIVSLLATLYGVNYFPLPGNADQLLTQSIDRGHISRFLLVWLIIAIPPSIVDLTSTIRKTSTVRKRKKPNLRILGSHLAHAGILILLVGHVLTTTLVDRVDPSHQITLIRNEQIRHGDFLYEMTDITTLVRDEDPEFSEKFRVADGFFGIQINVYDTNGELISSVEPGVLRFDSADGAIRPRSEVDRLVDWKGDTILILDLSQMNQIMTHAMMGELDDVDRVRLTVYDLPGSHLVWIGWIMIMIGSIFTLKQIRRNSFDESE